MVVFILQSLFLIAAAFIVGAILGNIFKRFAPKKESVSEGSTRAADARIASLSALGTPANDDVKKSAKQAAAMIPPAEPVPALNPAAKGGRKPAARKSSARVAAKRAKNPRQDDENRPVTLKAARRGKPDRLIEIDGIGNVIQSKLFELGIFHYDQIAAWSASEGHWVSEEIGFPGRAHREKWGEQAAALVQPANRAAKAKAAAKPAASPKAPAKTSRTGKSR